MGKCTKAIIGNSSLVELVSKGVRNDIPQKEILVAYLKSGVIEAAAAGRALDVLTGARIPEEWLSYTDGTYHWDTSLIYHFEKYNIPLSGEFMQYATA